MVVSSERADAIASSESVSTRRQRCRADVFMGRLLFGYRLNGKTYLPRVDVVSMYVDQFPINDMAREQAEEFGVKIYPSVAEALRVRRNVG